MRVCGESVAWPRRPRSRRIASWAKCGLITEWLLSVVLVRCRMSCHRRSTPLSSQVLDASRVTPADLHSLCCSNPRRWEWELLGPPTPRRPSRDHQRTGRTHCRRRSRMCESPPRTAHNRRWPLQSASAPTVSIRIRRLTGSRPSGCGPERAREQPPEAVGKVSTPWPANRCRSHPIQGRAPTRHLLLKLCISLSSPHAAGTCRRSPFVVRIEVNAISSNS